MSAISKIEWTDATWTPIRARRKDNGKVGVHCERVSAGCQNCYSATFNKRTLPNQGTGLDFVRSSRDLIDIFVDVKMLTTPLQWRKPRKIFVCSQTDLFAQFVTDEMIDRVFAVMALCPQHTFQVLTKRADRMREYMSAYVSGKRRVGDALRVIGIDSFVNRLAVAHHGFGITKDVTPRPYLPPKHVWLGVSVEDQKNADERIPLLLHTPAAVRFVSYEPALGPVNFENINDGHSFWTRPEDSIRNGLDWIIVGGESGPGARPMHPDWARSVRDECQTAGVPFFFKQWGEWAPGECVRSNKKYSVKSYFDGRWEEDSDDYVSEKDNGPLMYRIGKKAAGRLLDGCACDEFPQAVTA